MKTFQELAADLAVGGATSRGLVEACLGRIADDKGEGRRTFLEVYAEQARAAADAIDKARALGMAPGPYAGIPVSVKDLFDVAGSVTTGGSTALRDAPPATHDCPAVARMRAAGLIIIGRTNLTEFAFSALGINIHHDTPRNPWDRATGRVPGGSSSGAAVSVADGMAAMGLGSDTGGSVRIPAALSGIVGFKPTQKRVPRDGVLPLSKTLDSVGPLAQSVACCAIADAILAGEPAAVPEAFPLKGLRLAAPQSVVLDALDPQVAAAYGRALSRLARAGATIAEITMPELTEVLDVTGKGGFSVADAYAWHRPLLARAADQYDPWIRRRIESGATMTAADYIDLVERRADLIARCNRVTAPHDALVFPTVPIVAPTFAEVADDEGFTRAHRLLIRNNILFNFLDRCAISLPCHDEGDAPVGLELVGEHGADRRLLAIAQGVEAVLSAP